LLKELIPELRVLLQLGRVLRSKLAKIFDID